MFFFYLRSWGDVCFFFFFSSRRRHTRSKRDWSSDVCSSDLGTMFWLELSQILTYVPLTPLVYVLALRYPIRRDNWGRRVLPYLGMGVLFVLSTSSFAGSLPMQSTSRNIVTGHPRSGTRT